MFILICEQFLMDKLFHLFDNQFFPRMNVLNFYQKKVTVMQGISIIAYDWHGNGFTKKIKGILERGILKESVEIYNYS